MKPQQPPLTPGELRDVFDKARVDADAALRKSGVDTVLQLLSRTVRDLQDAGVDIGITVNPGSDSDAVQLVNNTTASVYAASGTTVDAYGYITAGKASRMFAIISRRDYGEALRLYLSDCNLTPEKNSGTSFTGRYFDFGEDATATQQMQHALAALCAKSEAVMDNDPGGVFNKDPAPVSIIKKPASKLTL